MIHAAVAEFVRLARRLPVWILTALIVVSTWVSATENVSALGRAEQNAVIAQSEHVVGCSIVVGNNPTPPTCTQGGSATVPSSGQPQPATGGSQASPTLQEVIAADRADASNYLGQIRQSLAPSRWFGLGIGAVASLPGLVLALLLGTVAVGGDYTARMWKTTVAAARSRTVLISGKLLALATAMVCWLLIGMAATVITYTVSLGGGFTDAITTAALPAAAVGCLLALALFAAIGALTCVITRSALGGLATGVIITTLLATAGFLSERRVVMLPGSHSPVILGGLQLPTPLQVIPAVAATTTKTADGIVSHLGITGQPPTPSVAIVILLCWLTAVAGATIWALRRQEIR